MPRPKSRTRIGDVPVAVQPQPGSPGFVPSYLSPATVYKLTSLSHVTIWRMVKRGAFPQHVPLTDHKRGRRRVGFARHQVEEWLRDPQGWMERNKAAGNTGER